MFGSGGGVQILCCEAVGSRHKGSLLSVLRGVTCLVLVLAGCSSPPARRDGRLIRAEDGRSTLAKKTASSPNASGARRVPLSQGHRSGPLAIQRYIVDGIAKAGPGRLLQLVPLNPIFDARRRFRAFRIVRVYDNSPRVLAYGVHPGDELVSVNGIKISRPNHMFTLFKLLPNASELTVVVRRGGTPIRLRIPIVDGAVGSDGSGKTPRSSAL